MTNLQHGQLAEKVAVEYLSRLGYKIIEQNWKTTWCEIDIVAQKKDSILFVEVKYRQSENQGKGFEYITPKKQAQMARSAEGWVQTHDWEGDYGLGAIEVTGKDYRVQQFIDEL